MAENRYKPYHPFIDTVEILRFTYDDGELCIEGLDNNSCKVVGILFYDVLLARIMPEGGRLRLLPELGSDRALVLTDEQSELTSWVLEEGLNTCDISMAKHYLVFVGREIVDVVSLTEPEFLT